MPLAVESRVSRSNLASAGRGFASPVDITLSRVRLHTQIKSYIKPRRQVSSHQLCPIGNSACDEPSVFGCSGARCLSRTQNCCKRREISSNEIKLYGII